MIVYENHFSGGKAALGVQALWQGGEELSFCWVYFRFRSSWGWLRKYFQGWQWGDWPAGDGGGVQQTVQDRQLRTARGFENLSSQ